MDISEIVGRPPLDPMGDCAHGHGRLPLQLIEEFASVAEPAALLRLVLLRAVAATAADRGIISWIEGEEMIVADCYDPFGELAPTGSRWPLDGIELNRLARASRQPVSGEPGREWDDLAPALRDTYAGLRHLLVVPVTVGSEDVAMLCVSRRRLEEFDDDHKAMLALIARAAAQPLRAASQQEQRNAVLEELRTHDARAESVERVKTDILRLASHELRTPLTVLHGYLSLIQEGFFGEISEPLAGVVSILNRRTADMNALVNDMLVAARVEDGASPAVGIRTDLREVVRQAFTGVQSRAGRDHTLHLILPDQPVHASVDADRVCMAMRNILDNAVKYSPHGGEVRCVLSAHEGVAVVRVTDHGLGIAAEDRDKLFSRFGRILTPANSHIPGIGLGLYFSREVARRHGGDVVLADGNDAGTVFELTLPLEPG